MLFSALLVCLAVCGSAVLARMRQPGLGLELEGVPETGAVSIVGSRDGLVPVSSTLVSVGAGDRRVEVRASDLIEEPDFFDTYPEMDEFFRRQTELREILRASEVTLSVKRDAEGPLETLQVRPELPSIRMLPGLFWFQILSGVIAFVVSMWVLALRPRELAVRIFAFMGASIVAFVSPAAIYGTRELAMDGAVFRTLSSLNHLGANLFGCGLVALFLSYPTALVRMKRLWIVPAVVLSWFFFDVTHLAPDQNWGSRAPILFETFVAIACAILQWRATRGDPRGRAGIRWLGVSVLVGTGLFVFGMVGSIVLGWFPPIAQGYAFGAFLLMHASFAFGLGHHRLFDLDRWAYTLLFWVIGGIGFIAIDAALIYVLDANRVLSTSGVLIAFGFLYLPTRSWLWAKIIPRRKASNHEIFDAVLRVTFARGDRERETRWKELLEKVFEPMDLRALDEPIARPIVRESGIVLDVPSVTKIPAQRLSYPWKGRGLFGPPHERLAANLVSLVRHAESQREAFERGARDERKRIAHDMHDDIGAGLLSSLYRDDLPSTRDAIRQAIGDVRSIVQELTWREVSFDDLIAEMRFETIQRLEAAKIAVDWPMLSSSFGAVAAHGVYRHLTSMVRELTSNVIRHSGASRVRCRVERSGAALSMTFADDGKGFEPERVKRGGLGNLERRAAALGGSIVIERVEGETVARIDVPIEGSPLRRPLEEDDVAPVGPS